jgi:uncharacterized membrane protein
LLLLAEAVLHVALRRVLAKVFWGELQLLPVQIYGTLFFAVGFFVMAALLALQPDVQVLHRLYFVCHLRVSPSALLRV